MCVWTAKAWTDCMSTLLAKRSKNDPISVFFGPVVEVASKVCPKGAQGLPQWSEMSVKGAQKEPKGWPREPKGAQRVPKGCLNGCPKGAQWVANGAQGMPKGPEMSK